MKRDFSGKTYWVIGASEGLGRALAKDLHKAGANLVLSARSTERLESLAATLGDARVVGMDVTSADSVSKAIAKAGPIDGLIYSVGLYEPMTAQTWNPNTAEEMCNANFLGALRVLGQTVPKMLQRNDGHIVLIGSLAGFRGLPGAIGYGASKAALMHLAENLYADTRKTGVTVQLANPGFIRTRLTDKNRFNMPMIMSPETASKHVLQLMRSKRFCRNFPQPFSWFFVASRFLPAALFHKLTG